MFVLNLIISYIIEAANLTLNEEFKKRRRNNIKVIGSIVNKKFPDQVKDYESSTHATIKWHCQNRMKPVEEDGCISGPFSSAK